jgi:hypothetical protein
MGVSWTRRPANAKRLGPSMPGLQTWRPAPMSSSPWVDMNAPGNICSYNQATEYEKPGELEILVREGKQDEALQSLTFLPTAGLFGRQLMEPCLRHRPPSKGAVAAAQKLRSELMENDDPFPKYLLGAWDTFCDQPEHADRELRRTIEQNYRAYPQMETDPLWPECAGSRSIPSYAYQALHASSSCRVPEYACPSPRRPRPRLPRSTAGLMRRVS